MIRSAITVGMRTATDAGRPAGQGACWVRDQLDGAGHLDDGAGYHVRRVQPALVALAIFMTLT
ncbi:hypothetical protein GCM10023322_74350 [Rugosimonospora acidiphila]|uniref:Uncharacterized protein n=1 Tax=Rugosimonospora acidiphila TaxID=556531 RepID=A0ABP9SML1_9ACTN